MRQMKPLTRTLTEPVQKLDSATSESSCNTAPKEDKLPAVPYMSKNASNPQMYQSTQSQTSSEVSCGVSPQRGSFFDSKKRLEMTASQLGMSSNGKGSTRLFKGVSLCPPIDPKTLFSPPINAAKSFKARENSSSNKKVRQNSTNSGQQRSKASQALQYYNCPAFSVNTSPQKRGQIKMLQAQGTHPASETSKKFAAAQQHYNATVNGFSLGALQPITNLPEKSTALTTASSVYESPVKMAKTMRKSISEKNVKPRFDPSQSS